jgi:hypothetical protein
VTGVLRFREGARRRDQAAREAPSRAQLAAALAVLKDRRAE